MTNTDERTKRYLDRWINIETRKRECTEDHKELDTEMKGAGLPTVEIAGIKLAGKRSFEPDAKRLFREAKEAVAESLGELRDTPLGEAAMRRVA